MKQKRFLLVCLFILLSTVSCSNKNIQNASSVPPTSSLVSDVEAKYYPAFKALEEGQEALKSVIFVSVGWSVQVRSHFAFGITGGYLLRYNLTDNTIDKIISLGESDGPKGVSLSSDGNYCVVYTFSFGDGNSSNYFLVDFEKEQATFISSVFSKAAVNKFPENIREQTENLTFKSAQPPHGCSITEEIGAEKNTYILGDKKGSKKQIKSLENLNVGGYDIIDENSICALIPTKAELSGELGYYKFAVIDAVRDKIIREQPINTK